MSSDATSAELGSLRPSQGRPLATLRNFVPGLRGRLLLAFIAISLFVVIAAAAGLYALREVEQTLDRITLKSVPVALDARELSRKSEKIVGAGPALVNASDAAEVEALSSRASGELVDTSTIVAHLRAADLDPGALDEIGDVMTRLEQNLSLMRSAALEGIAAAAQRHRAIGETLAAYRQFGSVWRPRFADLRTQVVRLQRAMTSAAAGAEERRAALDQFDQAMVALLALDQIQREAGNAFELISRAANAAEPAEIDNLQTQARRSIRAMDGLVSDIDPDISLELFEPLRGLRGTTIGDASIFAWVHKAIAIKAESRHLVAENEKLSVRLKAAVDRLVAASRGEIDSANADARRVQEFGRDILLAVAALSLISSFLIVWLYVGRSIVSRLTGLSSGMAAIAGGRRDVVVDTHGADEVSAMGRAVEVFRQNAIERDALLVERAEAAARLEGLVEERTAELARREAALRVMFDNMEQGVAMFDRDLILVAWNQHFRDLLQLTDAFLEGDPSFDDFFRLLAQRGEFGPGDVEEMVRERRMITDRAHFDERERPDGTSLEVRRNPIPGGGFVSMYTNITERKRAEAEIRAAEEAAEAALLTLREAQANLIQAEKMASLGQLTAGIAHEIKNPLNFINNFAGLSGELLQELEVAAAPAIAGLGEDKRAEVDEVLAMLTGNLEKIVEHGRRADGIVKGMLEHSRGGSGERRSVDLNGVVEEALNLAYHGARAQDQTFNITLERQFDAAMAPIELVPQDITRVFLNLFGNGFYAANKRRGEADDGSFKLVLTVTTLELGDAVEVKVRDNGTGIPPEITEKCSSRSLQQSRPGRAPVSASRSATRSSPSNIAARSSSTAGSASSPSLPSGCRAPVQPPAAKPHSDRSASLGRVCIARPAGCSTMASAKSGRGGQRMTEPVTLEIFTDYV
jgi:PAS domain S-box-containing protein